MAFAWTQLAFLRSAVLGKGIGEDDDNCWNMKGWMWPMPALTFWEDKGLAAARPGLLKPCCFSANKTAPFHF